MGFIGGYVIPEFGITEEDLKSAYYLIDRILFNSDITTNDEVNIIIIFNMSRLTNFYCTTYILGHCKQLWIWHQTFRS